ncbi:MAG TPA: cytochrome c biogenesis protein, partial [Aquifex aeolicus]|nr:cytochrome c biogenesis protein [Aquifex aeolicus]
MSSFGFLVATFILVTGVVIYGLFHAVEPGTIYWVALALSVSLFSVSFLLNLRKAIGELAKDYRRHRNVLSFLYDFFASLKLAIFIMLLIGIFSMLGSTYVE